MNKITFPKVTVGATIALAGALLYGAHVSIAAKTMNGAGTANAVTVSQGKALISQYRCNGCHAADLKGKSGFSPSLHQSGVLKEYKHNTFVRVLLTGVTNDGGHVRPPMPIYGKGIMGQGRPPFHRPPHEPPGQVLPGEIHGGPPLVGGMHPGGMQMPPPMTAGQAAAIYAYLHALK